MKAKILVYALPALILAAIHPAEAQHQRKFHGSGFFQVRLRLELPTNHSDKDFVTLVMWRDKISPLNIALEKYPG